MQTNTETLPRGRPAIPEADRMVQVQVRMPPAMRDGLDTILAERTDGQDRAGLIREILAEALAARGKGKRS